MSTDKKPIAKSRPDKKDLTIAHSFGQQINDILNRYVKISTLTNPHVPGNTPYKKRDWMPQISPKTDKKRCNVCSKCINICPTESISTSRKNIITNKHTCIICNACIKSCPQQARELKNVLFKIAISNIYKKCQNRKEPELYI